MLPHVEELFALEECPYPELFENITYPWEVIGRIAAYASDHAANDVTQATVHPAAVLSGNVQLGNGTVVGPHAVIIGPVIIGDNCEIRPGAYIRANTLIGDNVVVGNSTELKNALLFNNVQVPHFNYIGDSILGYKVHFGGGSVTSNQKSDLSEIVIKLEDHTYSTGMSKLGAIIGDHCELGSNVTLNPGTILGQGVSIYPGAVVRGFIPHHSIVKVRQQQEIVERT